MSWEVCERKVRLYLLNINHPVGGPKARYFLAHGFLDAEWQVLGSTLRRHPIDGTEQTDYELDLTIRCPVQTPDGSNPCIRTVWMVAAEASPRLVTAYPAES